MQQRREKVIVIGGGLGGLSAAISMASEGFQVEIVEKNERLGGKLNVLQQDGFTFDLGPSILTMPHIFEALFTRTGRRMSDYVTIEKVDPHWRNFFEDGTVIDLCEDPVRQKAQLDQLHPEAYTDFMQFMAYAKRLGQETEDGYFRHGIESLGALLKYYGLVRSCRFDVLRSMDQGVRRFIHHPKLVDILNYFIKYVGSSPYRAPALMNLLPYIQYQYGLWYVRGGMYGLAEALQQLAQELGVSIRLNSEVARIDKVNGRATSVTLADGEVLSVDIVISNMEVIPAMQRLLGNTDHEVQRMQRFAPSCSGLVLHLGINRTYPQLAHHNFFYSDKPEEHFRAVFSSGELSEDPTLYVVAPCKTDPAQAPEGCEVIKVLPHIPHLEDPARLTDADYQALRTRVLEKLERMGLDQISHHIVSESTWTPLDIQSKYYSNRGSIYGVVADRWLNLGLKAPRRSQELSNLYFVGGSVNPGGGMPMVVLSGQLVRDRILADLAT
ncbi:MAG: hypothetical protein RIQ52_559 [Pseudomonadota bacterium]|jgi:diapolycopene oxygenase